MPSIAVVIPLYQGERHVIDTLDSLAAQISQVDEVIVVDDGSTDNGPQLVENHPIGARLIRQRNAGVAVARNVGASASSSDYVAFLDHDDLWTSVRASRLRRYIQREAPDALVTSERSFYLSSDAGALLASNEQLHLSADFAAVAGVKDLPLNAADDGTLSETMGRIGIRDLLAGTVSVTTSYLFRRELVLAAGGCFPAARSHDDYWMLLNIARIAPIVHIHEPSVLYRIHPSSTTMSTRWSLPLLASQIAARHCGGLVGSDAGRSLDAVPPVIDQRLFWPHHIVALAREGRSGLRDSFAVIQLLATSPSERKRLRSLAIKAHVRAAVGPLLGKQTTKGTRRSSSK